MFGGLFESTPGQAMVEKATDPLLIGPDWALALDIADLVNAHAEAAKEVAKGVKRRISHKDGRVQMLALTLLESLMKNCGPHFYSQVAARDFWADLVKLASKRALVPEAVSALTKLVDGWAVTHRELGFDQARAQLIAVGHVPPGGGAGAAVSYDQNYGSSAIRPVEDDPLPLRSSTRGPPPAAPVRRTAHTNRRVALIRPASHRAAPLRPRRDADATSRLLPRSRDPHLGRSRRLRARPTRSRRRPGSR